MLYNAMIAPVEQYTIKGFLWYQGESNRKDPDLYRRLQPAFVKMLREAWGQGELPFYYVQIAPFAYEGAELVGSALLREAQLLNLKEIPNSNMVVTMDTVIVIAFIRPVNVKSANGWRCWPFPEVMG